MKNFKLLIFSTLAIFMLMLSCRDEEVVYESTPYLHFNKGVEKAVFVNQGTGSETVDISYSTISKVQSAAQVKLVVDTQFSTAVEGVDFQIVNPIDDVTAGENSGVFKVKLLESGATATSKKIVFRLQSATVANANFDQFYTLSYSKKCPVSVLLGSVQTTEAWWDAPGLSYIVATSTVPNQLLIKNFWDLGKDLKINYDPITYIVTVPDQSTEYTGAQGTIFAKQSTNGNQISKFNPCTRTINLFINYYIPGVGSYGNQVETFVGN